MTAQSGRAARFIERHSNGKKVRLWPSPSVADLVTSGDYDPVTHAVTVATPPPTPPLIPAVIRNVVDDRIFKGFRAQTYDAGDGQLYGSATIAKQSADVNASWSIEIDDVRYAIVQAEQHASYDKIIYRRPSKE